MKVRFEELKRIQRGQPVSPDINSIARKALEKNPVAIDLLNEAESKKWYGELNSPNETSPSVKVQMRRGIVQFVKILVERNGASFWMTVINDKVEFGKGVKNVENQ